MTVGLTKDMLFPLGKELTCPVCLSLLKPPIARLQCCHYFCQSCIRETLCARSQCPICNTAARRRDITPDVRMDRLAELYRQMEACTGEQVFCTQMPAKLEQEEEEEDGDKAALVLPTGDLQQHEEADAENILKNAQGEEAFGDSLDMLVAESQCPEPDFLPLRRSCLQAKMPGQPDKPATDPVSRGSGEAPEPDQASHEKKPAAAGIGKEVAPSFHGSKVEAAPKQAAGRGNGTPLQTFTRDKRKSPESERGTAAAATRRSKRNASDPHVLACARGDVSDDWHTIAADSIPQNSTLHRVTADAAQAVAGSAKPLATAAHPRKAALPSGLSAMQREALSAGAPEAGMQAASTRKAAAGAKGAQWGSSLADPAQQKSGGSSERAADHEEDVLREAGNLEGSTARKKTAALAVRGSKVPSAQAATQTQGVETSAKDTLDSGAEAGTGTAERRRIPSRLQPWSCHACTLDNPGTATRCSVCQTAKQRGHASASSNDAALHGGQPTEDVPLRPAHKRAAAASTPASAPPNRSTRVSQLKDARSRRSLPAGNQVSRPRSASATLRSSNAVPSARSGSRTSRLAAAAGTTVLDEATKCTKRQRKSTAELADAEAAHQDSGHQQPRGTCRRRPSTEADTQPVPVRWRGGRQNWMLLASGLEGPGRESLRRFAAASGARLAASWQPGITHIICGLDDQNRAKRTYKYMMGILHGAWIVGESWVAACAAAGCPVPEEPHEVKGDANGNQQGPILGRLHRPAKLLHGTEVYLAGAYTSKEEVTALLRAAGARLLTRPPARQFSGASSGNAACRSIILWDEYQPRRCVAAVVEPPQQLPLNWFLDSVSCFVLQPVEKYRL